MCDNFKNWQKGRDEIVFPMVNKIMASAISEARIGGKGGKDQQAG